MRRIAALIFTLLACGAGPDDARTATAVGDGYGNGDGDGYDCG